MRCTTLYHQCRTVAKIFSIRLQLLIAAGDPLCQVVAEIKVELRINSEGAVTGVQRLEEAQNHQAPFRTYIKSDPKLVWKPLPTKGDQVC